MLLEDVTNPEDKVVQSFVARLIAAEDKAQRKKLGMWQDTLNQSGKKSSVWSLITKAIKETSQKVKQYWQRR